MSTKDTAAIRSIAQWRRMFVLLMAAFFVVAAGAQQNNSSISGQILDPSGSPIAEANVQLREPATGLMRSEKTDGHGYYKFASLSPGTYDVSASKEGFEQTISRGFVLLVAQDAALNVALKVGSVQEQVSVDATPPLIDSNSAVVGQVIDKEQIVTYPLNGRDFLQLATLSAGVQNIPSGTPSFASATTNRPNVTVIVSGNRESATSYLLDGI
jgi:hypothetical protein